MQTLPILTQYEQLPDIYKQEANDFIEFLSNKANINIEENKSLKRNVFGSLKGKIKMSDDFDAPIAEFKEYT
jgi:hypothetical protein